MKHSISYVDALNEHYGAMGHPSYEWTINTTAPMTRLKKSLKECTVTLLTSGGISQCSAAPWDPLSRNDHRLDAIPNDANGNDLSTRISPNGPSEAAVPGLGALIRRDPFSQFPAACLVPRRWPGAAQRRKRQRFVNTDLAERPL